YSSDDFFQTYTAWRCGRRVLIPRITRLGDVGLVGRLRLQAGVVGAYDGQDRQYISADEFMFTQDLEEETHHETGALSCFYGLGRERVPARDARLPAGKGITTLANPEGSSSE